MRRRRTRRVLLPPPAPEGATATVSADCAPETLAALARMAELSAEHLATLKQEGSSVRFYLAGRYGRRDELRGYAEELQALGHEVTSRWLWEVEEGVTDDGVTITGDHRMLFRAVLRDLHDIGRCEMLVSFTEDFPGDGLMGRGGRHVELGVAIGRGKELAIIGLREHLFHQYVILCYADWQAFKDALQR